MRVPSVEVSRQVKASPEAVWSVATDLDAAPKRISAITEVERLDDGHGFGVGTRWRETRKMFGREASEEMVVSALAEGRRYTTEADGPGAHYTSSVGVEPFGDGHSMLTMSFKAVPRNMIARVTSAAFGWVVLGATRRALESDLADIAAAAEAVERG